MALILPEILVSFGLAALQPISHGVSHLEPVSRMGYEPPAVPEAGGCGASRDQSILGLETSS